MSDRSQQGPTSGVTPHLTVLDRRCREAIAFYEHAFGAEQAMPPMPAGDMPGMTGDDRVMHAHLKLNGGSLMLNDAFPEFTPGDADHASAPAHTTLHLQVEDADAWFDRAMEAGAIVAMPLADQFWGDRYGQLKDPFGFTMVRRRAAQGRKSMTYVSGIVIAVPKANKDRFIAHAKEADPIFLELGATRILECWEEDVPDGKLTDFRRAVQATADEAVVFSWMEWPDKATCDAGMTKMMAPDFKDPRMDPETNPMPFDGKRMIFGGFTPVVELGG